MDAIGIYSLKLYDRKPDELPMDRLADYLREFALILGKENHPVFSSIRESSVVLCAKVPEAAQGRVEKRLLDAQRGEMQSGIGKHLVHLETMMLEDGISKAEFLDPKERVIYSLLAANEPVFYTVNQSGEIDGEITGVVGADDTLHIRVRDWAGRDVRLITRDLSLGHDLAKHFRSGILRLYVQGQWNRLESGWMPDSRKCVVNSFQTLNESSATEVFNTLRAIPGNGWASDPNATSTWANIRGLNE